MPKSKFDPQHIVQEAIKKYGTKRHKKSSLKPVNEMLKQVSFTFRDEEDMCDILSEYVYEIFEKDEKLKEYDTTVDNFIWSDAVSTIDAFDTENENTWVIIMNPKFAALLLDRQAEFLKGEIDYDAEREEFPENYFRLYKCAVIYGAILAKIKSGSMSSIDSYQSELSNLAGAPRKAFSDFRTKFSTDYPDMIGLLEKALNDYFPKL